MALRSSGTCCAARGCTNNRVKLNLWLGQQCFEHTPRTKRDCPCLPRYSFYRLPADEETKRAWLRNLKVDTPPPKTVHVCSFHFVDRMPTEENPHPTLWLGPDEPPEKKRRLMGVDSEQRASDEFDVMKIKEEEEEEEKPGSTVVPSCGVLAQWSDNVMEDHSYSRGPINVHRLRLQLPKLSRPSADIFLVTDVDSLLYTGLRLVEFRTLVTCLKIYAPTLSSLPAVDQILMTLMKLRQNFATADLARQFKTTSGDVSWTIGQWIDIMSEHLKDLVLWLPRDLIKATLPQYFKKHFANTTCVVGCTETVLQGYSHTYANNTVKYLVAVSPSGNIMFISNAYSGKCSDRYITQNSGVLDYLSSGDEVMGGSGFTVCDLLAERNVDLILPVSRPGESQPSFEQQTDTRRIARARMSVEREMGRLRAYRILSQKLPMNFIPRINSVLKICAGLVNLRGRLIPS